MMTPRTAQRLARWLVGHYPWFYTTNPNPNPNPNPNLNPNPNPNPNPIPNQAPPRATTGSPRTRGTT